MFLDLTQPKHQHVDQRLRNEPIIWIGSVRPDGRPHMVPVWFLWDRTSIFIFSQPKAQKIRNLESNPNVTLALEAANAGADIAIVEGTAIVSPAANAQGIMPAYSAKYAQAIAEMSWNPETMLSDYSQLIQVTPTRLIAW